jgi:hypothetical protein
MRGTGWWSGAPTTSVVRSPGNPGYDSGNFLLFDDAPDRGDANRWVW